MTNGETWMLGERDEEVKVQVVVAVERRLLDDRLDNDADRDVWHGLQCLNDVANDELSRYLVRVILDQ